MALSLVTQSRLERLKQILQEDISASTFENVVAALLSEHLELGIAVAKSGFQHGGDGGPAGRQGRRFRIETKRYADTTSLSDRELLGEVDHALKRDPALEAWFLAATRQAPEQLELDLMRKSDDLGVPIVVIDWKKATFPTLAALCTAQPDVLETMVSSEAAQIARDLKRDGEESLKRLSQDLEAWNLGFVRLRELTAAKLGAIWTAPRVSAAALGQDAAGGAYPTTIKRARVHAALDQWWTGRAAEDAPAAVIGWQGAGKTWAALQWTIEHIADQPLVLIVPSSAVAGISTISKAGLKRFIGERLYDLTEARDAVHWQLRFDRLLLRPPTEGPVLTLILDGMNQEPSAPWLDILKLLQDPEFSGRIRTIAITRNLHFTDRLSRLRGLIVVPEEIEVDIYDGAEGGELDQRLAAEGLTRGDLHEDLIEIARTPRLFNLVVRLRQRLANADQVTVHRLLWEYGRDTFGIRDGAPFSETDWRGWLTEVAQHRLGGIHGYNLRALGEMVERPDLTASEVFRRLSEIVDGEFVRSSAAGQFEFTPTLVAHALGAALLEHLGSGAALDRDSAEKKLADWLDPIAGLDEKAEILRAAVSILLESDMADAEHIASALLFEWLRSQNIPEQHRTELARIAAPLCAALLDVVALSGDAAMGSARLLAVNALRAISRDDLAALDKIVEHCRSWLKVISRDVDPPRRRHEDTEKARSERLMLRVGADEDGERTVLGRRITFVERQHRDAETTIPSLLEGFPLVPALPVFEFAALALAIRHREAFWDGLKWLCLLNGEDFAATSSGLREKAVEIAATVPEPGIHPELGRRVGALLLWLSGDEDNEAEAVVMNPPLDRNFDYERDYLSDPSRSFFALEVRHAETVLANAAIPLRRRIDRAASFFPDPDFTPPAIFCAELRQAMQAFDMAALDTSLSRSAEDHAWEEIVPALARCAPDLLAALARAKLHGLATRPAEQRYVTAIRSLEHYVVADQAARVSAHTLRTSSRSEDAGEEAFAASRLLILEIDGLPPVEQFASIVEADLKDIYQDFSDVLPSLSSEEVDALVRRYRHGSEKHANDLVLLLSIAQPPLNDESWEWLAELADDHGCRHRGVVFEILHTADAGRFGRALLQQNWTWSTGQDLACNHFGSLALAAASAGLPFDQHAPAIAPWLLLRAVSLRGGSAADAETGAAILGSIVGAAELDAPDLGSDISVSQETRERHPFSISVAVRPENPDDPFAQFRDAMDTDKRLEARRRAVSTAVERIKSAREAGASLYLHNLRADDFAPVIEHVPRAVTGWIEGHDGPTADFKRRVRLAEGFYLALCEALLARDPDQGARLWRGLRAVLTTRFLGRAGVDQLIQMVFRIPAAPEALRTELLDLSNTNSDQELFDLALAAMINGADDWLNRVIADDENAGIVWRRQRAGKLRGFRAGNRLPMQDAWPVGPAESLRVSRERTTRAWMRSESFARHWWERYWNAESDEEAYAAWELLSRCIDRRAYLWMSAPTQSTGSGIERNPRRIAHAELNFDDLKAAMKKAEKKMDQQFLERKITNGIGPWGKVQRDI